MVVGCISVYMFVSTPYRTSNLLESFSCLAHFLAFLLSPHTMILALDDGDGERYKVVECGRAKRKYVRFVFICKNCLSSNQKIALNINTNMPSILVLDVVMQVGFTESKDVRVVLEHKCFNICEISPQTSHIGVVDCKRWR